MISDWLKKKAKKPAGNGDASLEVVDMTDQVPQSGDVLDEIDRALSQADRIIQQLKPQQRCGC